MRVIETYVASPKGPEANEDRLVVTPHFVAVLDGATEKRSGVGPTPGWWAAERVARLIERLDAQATAQDFVRLATDVLVDLSEDDGAHTYRAATQAVVYSVARREIWRVGDCSFRLDGEVFQGGKLVDDVNAQCRGMLMKAWLLSGKITLDDAIHERDRMTYKPWRDVPLAQGVFQNRDAGDSLDYGVLDGTPVPPRFVDVHDASRAREVVLCSDGFVTPPPTLADGLARLAHLKAVDPCLLFEEPSTRGFLPGSDLFDDTTYVRFEP